MIVKSIKSIVMLLAVSFSAGQALAELNLNVDAGFGRRWTKAKVKSSGAEQINEHANEYIAAVQSQIMDLPLSAGASFSLVDIHDEEADTNYGLELAITAKAWLPESVTLTELVVPFVKVGYIAFSDYTFKDSVVKASGSAPGYRLALGADIAVTEDFVAIIEYAYSDQNIKYEVKSNGVKFDSVKANLSSQTLLIGAQVRV